MVSVADVARRAVRRHANTEVLFVLDEPKVVDEPPTLERLLLDNHVKVVVANCSGGLAHHFNNVLSGVLGLASLAPNLDSQVLSELCDRLKGQVDHTSGILRLVLTLTRRAESERHGPRCEVRAPVKAAVDLIRTTAPAHVGVELVGPVEETWVPASAVAFGRMLLVTVATGVDLAGRQSGGRVRLSASRRAGRLVIAVEASAGWAELVAAPPLSAAIQAGRAPSPEVLARAAIEDLARAASGTVRFGGEQMAFCELVLPMITLP